MAKYQVKLEGQVLVEDCTYQEAVEIAAELNGKNITEFGDRSIADTGLNLYEPSLASEDEDGAEAE